MYTLTVRLLFGEFISPENNIEKSLLILAILVLIGLLASGWFAFQVIRTQEIKKADLNNVVISFYNENKLIDIYNAMSKRFSESLEHNKNINAFKVKNVQRSFFCIIITVVLFILFIATTAFNANSVKTETITEKTTLNKESASQASPPIISTINFKKEISMSVNNDEIKPKELTQTPEPTTQNLDEEPNQNVVAPEFTITTESIDLSTVLSSDEKLK